MIGSALAFGTAFALLIVGLVGVFLPAIPGVGLMWIVILVYAIWERFKAIDPLSFAVLTILGILGATSDIWLSQLGAKVGGASMWSRVFSLVGALLGGLIGLFVSGVAAAPGLIVGGMLGVLLNEYRERRAWKPAWRATVGLVLGFTLSNVLQVVIGVLMIVIFVWQVFRG